MYQLIDEMWSQVDTLIRGNQHTGVSVDEFSDLMTSIGKKHGRHSAQYKNKLALQAAKLPLH